MTALAGQDQVALPERQVAQLQPRHGVPAAAGDGGFKVGRCLLGLPLLKCVAAEAEAHGHGRIRARMLADWSPGKHMLLDLIA